ncbi:MAG TPA: DUF1844 domain-containing protein [Patescibacteria group bacterium]|nr:DUF1844 domain-containing protein [Patescibacteria group bacterium]
MQKIDFNGIVQMFQMEAFAALGKIKHPALDKIEKNLEHAQFLIDLLTVLQEKTQGNLTDQEKRFIDYALSDLKLNYVEVSGNPSTPPTADMA